MPSPLSNQDLDVRQFGSQFGSLAKAIPSGPVTPGLLDDLTYNPPAGGANHPNGNAGGQTHNTPRSPPWSSSNTRGQN